MFTRKGYRCNSEYKIVLKKKRMEYFNYKDFDCPTSVGSGKRHMDEDFLWKLDEAREFAQDIFVINSGYRTVEHNNAVGGSKTSSHLLGLAADISCNNSVSRFKIVNALLNVGFVRIGISNSFIHVDMDRNKSDSIWTY